MRKHPDEIVYVETAPGVMEPEGKTQPTPPEPAKPIRRGPIDDIPSIGTPTEFWTMIACLFILKLWLH